MELKVTHQGVSVEETVFDQLLEQPIDTEFTLPDYCPDISRVLKCRIIPKITSRSVSGSAVNMDGNCVVSLLYADTDGQLRSYDHAVAFSKSADMDSAPDGLAYITVGAKSDFVNCRPITERKVDIHGSASIRVKVVSNHTTEVVADLDGCGMQMLRGTCPATTPMGGCEKYLILNDEIEIADGAPAIRNLLRCEGSAVATECKVISNKAVVKGDMQISALYCSEEDGLPELFSATVPLSQIVDIEGIAEGCSCSVDIDVVTLELKPRTGMSGEARSFTVSAKLCMSVKASCDNEIAVIYDAYSTDFKEQVEHKDITCEKLIKPIREFFTFKKSIEVTPDEVGSLIDSWCEMGESIWAVNDNELKLSGTATVCILSRDMNDQPVYFERPIDYEYSCPLENAPESVRCDNIIRAKSSSAVLTGSGSVEITINASMSIDVFEMTKMRVITGAAVNQDEATVKDDSSLMIYYAGRGERIFDIAKRYCTCPGDIKALNTLDCEELSSDKMLMIPR